MHTRMHANTHTPTHIDCVFNRVNSATVNKREFMQRNSLTDRLSLSSRGPHPADGEPRNPLQSGTPAAVDAAEAPAQEGQEGPTRSLSVAAQPQGRPQQQQQQHVQRGLPGPGLWWFGVEARRQGRLEVRVRHGLNHLIPGRNDCLGFTERYLRAVDWQDVAQLCRDVLCKGGLWLASVAWKRTPGRLGSLLSFTVDRVKNSNNSKMTFFDALATTGLETRVQDFSVIITETIPELEHSRILGGGGIFRFFFFLKICCFKEHAGPQWRDPHWTS